MEPSCPAVQPAWYVNNTFSATTSVKAEVVLSAVAVSAAAVLKAALGLFFKES